MSGRARSTRCSGENGAGKSTLMKIIYGVVKPDAGTIDWNGKRVAIANPARARKLGIGMVFQHFSLFETLTVAENIALALDPGRAGAGLAARIRDVSDKYGLPLDPDRHVHSMSVGERQRVEIVRCLLQDPHLLIMDEPTSVLTPQAVEKLFETLRRLAAEGCSILYISHKLDEIRALCHRATVLRGGKVTGECDPRQESSPALARMMIGGDLPHPRHREAQASGDGALVVSHLTLPSDDPFGTALHDVKPHRSRRRDRRHRRRVGQRPDGIAGGAFGRAAPRRRRGASSSPARRPAGSTPGARRALGMSFVPEDRLGRGAVPGDVARRKCAPDRAPAGPRRAAASSAPRPRAITRPRRSPSTSVKAGGPDAVARSLSGGNLQKFIVGREIRQRPKVLIAAQPTWGVDVGAAAQIRQALIDLRDAGVAVLVVSEESGRAVRDLRPPRRHRPGPAVGADADAARPMPTRSAMLMSGSFISAAGARTGERQFSPAGGDRCGLGSNRARSRRASRAGSRR